MATLYQATEWDTGDTITKDKMNKIEKGIETNSKEFGNYATRIELSDYIPNSAKGVSVATLENGKIPMSQIPDSDTGQAISGYVKDVTSDGNATLTITTDSSPHNIKINNVENAVNADLATKATQDSQGRTIYKGYLERSNGYYNGNIDDIRTEGIYSVASSTTGNKPKTWGRLLVLNSSYNSTTGWTWQMFFYTNINEIYVRNNISNGVWTSWEKIAFTSSPSFSGTPTAPTPSTSDNSTKLATTAFVKSQSASMRVEDIITSDNYWVKEPSGLITQFVEIEAATEEIEVPLPLAFSDKCLFVDVDVLNQEKDTSMDVKFNTIEKGLNSVKLLKIGTGTPKITVRVQGV